MSHFKSHTELLPHLFRQEYAKMTAVLCRHFGLEHIEIAEDIASDTFLKASEHWAVHGVPENPAGWLYAVARNKAKDHVRHLKIVRDHAAGGQSPFDDTSDFDFEVSEQIILDSQLAMIFAVCNDVNSPESQISLALQILCGFSVGEIANAFLTNKETIKKRLQRARQQLRTNKFSLRSLEPEHIRRRQDAVLKTIYLLFNEGYFSRTHRTAIRKELCSEAIRLALCLTDNKLTCTPQVYALLALMCYQSSRLEARLDGRGEVLLFDEQDKSRWDQQLIDRGNHYLVAATEGNEVSRYHLEAAVAYWHTTDAETKWQHILDLYNQLVVIEYSPGTALSRAFALSKVMGKEKAIEEVEELRLESNSYYHALLGYLYAEVDREKAVRCYERAIELTASEAERRVLVREAERLKNLLSEVD